MNSFLGIDRSVLGRSWRLRTADETQVSALTRQADVSDAVARVLASRGIDAGGADLFLHPTLKSLMPDPKVFAGMDDAVARIVTAIKAGERIAVFGDYDVDGATSSALLMRFFRAVGGDIITYIPDRRAEGYGPNEPALRKLHGDGVKLVITVDCGITAFAPLAAAHGIGLDVIVVDHHKADAALPAAIAVVNPNRLDCTSHQGHLAAVGVAFLLIVAVNRALRDIGWYDAVRPEPDLRQWLDLVALGTVCDVVPLNGLNRAFVVQGLNVLGRGGNVGLTALSKVARIDSKPSAFHLGFLLGPRVNAGGRVGQADLGTRLLSTEDADEAAALALRLDEFNASRKEIEAAVLQDAIEQVETQADPDAPVLFAAGLGWHPGVIGIVAGRLKERYDRPACVIALEAGMSKGSGRSVAGIDLGRAVIAAREAGLLINGGGHAMAAGFTVAEESREAFCAFMQAAVRDQRAGEPIMPRLSLDGALAVSAVTTRLIEELACVAPFGAGNEEPRFAVVDAEIVKADVVGMGHVRCILTGRGGGRLTAIAFNCVDSDLGQALLTGRGSRLHLAGTIRPNTWQGRTEAQLVIDDAAVPVSA
ncbi:MAG: single-stranded-DNA-specific exonuclease RecJ [Rhodospirillaceae bacterium]